MLVSIVTINYNNVQGLMDTLESVRSQRFTNYEHIIVDGASTDDSIDVIKKYSGGSGKWVSEKDNGVYDAQNKGVRMAIGNYILFLNSGDYFSDEHSLEKLMRHGTAYDLVYGDVIYKKGRDMNYHTFPEEADLKFMFEKGLPHPSTIIRRKLFDKIGLYNTSSKIVADWEFFMLALFKHNATSVHVKYPVTVFDCTGISSADANVDLTVSEQLSFLQKHFPSEVGLFKRFSYYIKKQQRIKTRKNILAKMLRKITG